MRSRQSVNAALRQVLGRSFTTRTRVRPAPAPEASRIDPATCTHLFESRRGGRRCRHCGAPPPGARPASGSSAPYVRQAVPEKHVQRAVIHLLVAIGCRYDPKGLDTDIYVLGTTRPRQLSKLGHRTFQTPGIGDVFAFLPLRPHFPKPGLLSPPMVWIEVKAADGGPSPAQEAFELRCQVRGISHVMGGVDEVSAFLVTHGFLRESGR